MEISLTAFATDCIVRGVLALGAERLADHLNEGADVAIRDAVLTSLDDGHQFVVPSLEVPIADLCVVVAGGPRGAVGRRVRDRSDLVDVRVGPYSVVGDLHSPPGSTPFLIHRRRGTFIAMTDAHVIGPAEAVAAADWPTTLLVNWPLIVQVMSAGGAVEHLPDPLVRWAPAGERAREILT